MVRLIPADKPRQAPTQEPIEKVPQFLLNLEDHTEHIRSMIDSFVRRFEDMDSREKRARIVRISELVNSLCTQVIGLARNRGEEEELRRELTLYLKPKTWKNEQGKFDYGRYVSALNNALSTLQVFLERNQMLLTFQPVPADFSEQLIEGIVDDIKAIAEEKAKESLDARHKEQLAKFQELEAAGKLTPEKLAALTPEERRMVEALSLERLDEGIDELGEEANEAEDVKMDDSDEDKMDESEQPVPEIDDDEVD